MKKNANTKPKVSLAKIKAEVIAAYCESTRNLHFKASGAMGIDAAVKTMTKALDLDDENTEGYNDFKPNFFRKLPKGTKITLARAGSVCAYIKLPKTYCFDDFNFHGYLSVDEADVQSDGTIRLWWD